MVPKVVRCGIVDLSILFRLCKMSKCESPYVIFMSKSARSK